MSDEPRVETQSPHLTVKQLAERWQVTPKAIYNLRWQRKLPAAISRGRAILWPLSVIQEYEASLVAADPKAPEDAPAAA